MSRHFRSAVAALFLLLPVTSPVHATPSLWFADSSTLYQADLAAHTLTRRLALKPKALAADAAGGAWVVTASELIRLDAAGVSQLVKARKALGLEGQAVLAADPWDGSLWLSTAKTLLHINPDGLVLHKLALAQPKNEDEAAPVALAVGLDQSVWRLTPKSLSRYTAAGVLLAEIPLKAHLEGAARYLVLDPLNPIVWIAAGEDDDDEEEGSEEADDEEEGSPPNPRTLLRLDFTRAEMIVLSLAAPPLRALAFDPHNGDPALGRLWALSAHALARYRADGSLEKTLDLTALGLSAAKDLTLAPGSGTPWIGHRQGVSALASEGTLGASLAADKAVKHAVATLLRVAPTLTLLAPPAELLTNNPQPTFLLGYGAECNALPCGLSARQWAGYQLRATLNERAVGDYFTLNPDTAQTSWSPATALAEGRYRFSAQVLDAFGHASTPVASVITIDTTPPVFLDLLPENGRRFTVTNPADTVNTEVTGRLSEPGLIHLQSRIVQGPAFRFPVTLLPGLNTLALNAVDMAGNHAALTLSYPVQVTPALPPSKPLPPDPALVAPPVNPTTASILATITAFLYTGTNPIQTGVAPGTIVPKRAAVLRGQMLSRDNTPLPGVTLTVHGHPEFGQTLSRADGRFDMAVNGGGTLTLNYTKTGYLPAQRQLSTPWQDFAHADTVVLIPLDTKVTTIDLSANTLQVAQGNPVTDSDGTRTATMLFPAGTQATMTLPDGTTQALTTLNVRASEYTVGENGPQAMPASLPPTSGYTYAVELSVDEAMAAGAKTVTFSQPVPVYVDNFLNFPVGDIVPVGYYDRDKASWIPAPNGRVIKILSTAGGLAQLDTNGDGLADDATQLAALNITAAEQAQLASLYAPGKTLWRVAVKHFTPWDWNWPFGLAPGDTAPNQPDPKKDQPEDKACEKKASIIECQNQTLGERLPVTGTPFSLNYRSARVPGRKSNVLDIPLSGATPPKNLKRIDLEISVAGRLFKHSVTQTLIPTPHQTYRFEWDGKDVYGRSLQGSHAVVVRTGYSYRARYGSPAPSAQSFGAAASGSSVTRNLTRQEIILWQTSRATVQAPSDARTQGMGGWSLSAHHGYDPQGQTLYLGDGTRRSAQSLNRVITTVALLGGPHGVAVDAEGNLYVADRSHSRLYKVTPEGITTTVAGNTYRGRGFYGDGGPATEAGLNYPEGVAVDAQGSLYIADTFSHRIRKVTPEGIISTVAGNGSYVFSGDGGLATAAGLYFPSSVAVDAQGNLYIADYGNSRIRKVTPAGLISTVAGNGIAGFAGDGGPATGAPLAHPRGIALDAQGTLYVTSNYLVRKVTPDGIISTVAGTNRPYGSFFSGDGGLATAADFFNPQKVAVDAEGSLYIADMQNNRIRKVTPDGIITTVAGNGTQGFSGDGSPATAAGLFYPVGVAVDAEGVLYIGDSYSGRIRKVAAPFSGFSGADLAIPSEDGTQLYHFDPTGRHLRTLSTSTKAVIYTFSYNPQGYLTRITDGDGDSTVIDRDSAGNATAIVSADGKQTTLTVDANGYLASVSNPANETHRMAYTNEGLLTTFTDPRGNTSTMQYDARGLLTRDANAAGGFWALSRSELAIAPNTGYEARLTSAQGRTTRYRVEHLATGDQRRINTEPDGTVSTTLIQANGSTTHTRADGTISTTVEGPDPRFGMQAPLTTSAILKTPSGLTSTVTATRTASLSNPLDPLSLVTQTDTITVNGKTATTVFDAALKHYTATSPAKRKSLIKIDAQGRPLFAQLASLEAVNYQYDSRGRLSQVSQGAGLSARTVSYAYGTDGALASSTDALGRVTTYQRDAVGRVTATTLPGSRQLSASYDASGNLSRLTPPGKTAHGFAYTAVDRISDYAPPAAGLANANTQYAWSLDQDLTQTTWPDGTALDFSYDTGGRLSAITPVGAASVGTAGSVGGASVGAASAAINYTYAPTGRPSTLTTGEATLTLAWDGPLPTQETLTGSITGSLSRVFNTDFQVSQLTVNGVTTAFAYDADGLLTRAGSLSLSRDPGHGAITGSTLGSLTTTQTYTGFGELQSFTATHANTALLSYQLEYDKGGRITSKTETATGGQSTVYTYGYDAAGRLASISQNGTVTATYGYDANGNRSHVNAIALATIDAQDRLLSYGNNTYAYSARGSLQSKTGGAASVGAASAAITTYTYDTYGNLKTVILPAGGRLDYLVDGKNRRIGKKVNGALTQGFLYQSQLKIAAELDGNNNIVARFTYAEKPNVPELMEKGGVTYRLITDHLGSVRLVVNTTDGSIAQRIDYDEWGNITANSNPGFQPFGFAGGLYDSDTQLTRFGARDYEAETGRWTAKDPIAFEGGDSNLYAYVGGNPLSYTDPLGLWTFDFGAGAHIWIPGMIASIGPNATSSWVPGGGIEDASSGLSTEVVLGVFADIGVNAGVGGFSQCPDAPASSLNFGLGRYGGVQLGFKGGKFDGISVGLGLGFGSPISYTQQGN